MSEKKALINLSLWTICLILINLSYPGEVSYFIIRQIS
jgi:hypothetical protein